MTHSTLDRYGEDVSSGIIYDPDGQYVYYSHYAELKQQRDDLQEQIKELVVAAEDFIQIADRPHRTCDRLKAAIAKAQGDKT